MSEKILVVEDEQKIARVIELELEHEGYIVDKAATGHQALDKAQSEKWDLILLDVMIPQLNGMEVLRRIRSAGSSTPIIMVTARDSVIDKVSGLDQWANDYITKPFEIEELLARIRACLRNSRHSEDIQENQKLQILDLSLQTGSREVKRDKQTIQLTAREFDLLLFLMQNQKHVLTREQILSTVWGYDYYGDTNVVDVYIRYLRKKVDAPFAHPLIRTVRGVGYVLKE
ncbi:response regulator transcription factor [Sporolactobacillus sp. STSJ-5]|uniref:response regulator transcription factor n=1 Tax=Sporolactobacillus sp. STSJ-5 TaxID=2965076 RepID=UPI0021038F18|nr:response regulator transcription factor [Sporolactobacillus sp. STSJ-5]MCQ2009302.1 response regulator transcription factor [Sporolactobacillus sp. STSJ-5]